MAHNLGFSLFLFFSFFSSFGCCFKNADQVENIYTTEKYSHASKATVFIVIETISKEGILVYTGTGVSIEKHGNHVYVLTAGHVCLESSRPETFSKISIIDVHGKTAEADILMASLDPDVCILNTTMDLPIAQLDLEEPTIGDRIHYTGYPDGLYWSGVLHHFDGRYAGMVDKTFPIYNFPIVGGSSGSPVYNEEGKVIGIISAVTINFEHVGIGVSSKQIYNFLMSY